MSGTAKPLYALVSANTIRSFRQISTHHDWPPRADSSVRVGMGGPMDIFSTDGRRLATLADWRNHSGTVSWRHWAEGGSPRELARAWLEGDAATQVTSLLTLVPELGGLVLDRGI